MNLLLKTFSTLNRMTAFAYIIEIWCVHKVRPLAFSHCKSPFLSFAVEKKKKTDNETSEFRLQAILKDTTRDRPCSVRHCLQQTNFKATTSCRHMFSFLLLLSLKIPHSLTINPLIVRLEGGLSIYCVAQNTYSNFRVKS